MKTKPPHLLVKSMDLSSPSESKMVKRPSRREKEKKILVDLIEYYIKTGRPVGSDTLKEASILDVSSATIRNYFASLEEDGYLKQQHTSGGRVPQKKAYSLYAEHCLSELHREWKEENSSSDKNDFFQGLFSDHIEPTEILIAIQHLISHLSKNLSMAAVITAPRFDHDSIVDIRYIYIDSRRILSIIITEFGLIHTTTLPMSSLNQGVVKKAERYSRMRLFQEPIEDLSLTEQELDFAKKLYQETVSSYFIMYSSLSQEDVFKAGFSNVFAHPDFQDAHALKSALFFFENTSQLRSLLRDVALGDSLQYWIGRDLFPESSAILTDEIAFIAAPYRVGSKSVGALGVLMPIRSPYKNVFSIVQKAVQELSHHLTKVLIKHRITFRMPQVDSIRLDTQEVQSLEFFS